MIDNSTIPGMSVKRRMHSLNPYCNSLSWNWFKMATPIQRGNEELPSNKVSHKWTILCNGKTSVKLNIFSY